MPAPLLAGALTAILAVGCGGPDPAPSAGEAQTGNSAAESSAADGSATDGAAATSESDPPVPTAPAREENSGDGGSITPAELKEQLGVEQALIRQPGGRIRVVSIARQGVEDISPLKGLPLKILELTGCPVSDIGPLKGMPLEELYMEKTQVEDLSPLTGMPLKKLYLNETPISDLGPLAKTRLEMLNLTDTPVQDIGPVKNLPLNTLWLRGTQVKNLSPLQGKHLESLDVQDAPVADLSPLRGMGSLRRLNLVRSQVIDLTPLKDLRLTRLLFTPKRIERGLDVVRGMDSLKELDVEFRRPQRLSPGEFWKRYEAGEFGGEDGKDTGEDDS